MMYFCRPTLKFAAASTGSHRKPQWDFSTDFGFLQENKLPTYQQKLMILSCFAHSDNIHELTQLLWILKLKYNSQK